MSNEWRAALRLDPLPALMACPDPALAYFIQRDLLEGPVGPLESLWELLQAQRLLAKQQADGSWRYPGKPDHPAPNANYSLLETYRSLRVLVEMFGFTNEYPALAKAAEYIFTCQTNEGDIRGILGNQYMPYYHGGILELLIKSGYANDRRVEKGLQWLLSMRQADGAWIIPVQLIPSSQRTDQFWLGAPLPPERSRPHSHLATGMVLRAFTAHPGYRARPEIGVAGQRLKERIFQPDKYNDRKAGSYWLKFQFPFWWPNLLTALDSLSRLNFDREDADIARGLDWFLTHQSADGLWEIGYGSGKNIPAMRHWVGLAICRVLVRFFDQEASS